MNKQLGAKQQVNTVANIDLVTEPSRQRPYLSRKVQRTHPITLTTEDKPEQSVARLKNTTHLNAANNKNIEINLNSFMIL